jgi:hypothetical protein
MKIGFLNNTINERGTTWQSYLYAKTAQKLFGHKGVLLYPDRQYMFDHSSWTRMKHSLATRLSTQRKIEAKVPYDQKMADRIIRDGVPIREISLDADFSEFDAVHHFKPGKKDAFRPKGTRYCVHAVFDASQPHGDRYAAVSEWLGHIHQSSVVPNIVDLPQDNQTLRQELNIPSDAVVLARYGARNTFDVPWIWESVAAALACWKNIFFLFANTDVKIRHERVIDLPTIYDGDVPMEVQKRRFINTSDAMIHARARGETFGLAVGEFAVCGKPVLTYGKSPEQSHYEMLRNPARYDDPEQLKRRLEQCVAGELAPEDGGAYRDCTAEKATRKFEEIFIQ